MKKPPVSTSHFKTAAKAIGWIAVGMFLLFIGAMTTLVKVLHPDRLTPLVERIGSAYLDAEVKASRIELSFWSTFPHLTLQVDSLEIVSHSLKPLSAAEKAALPPDADKLLSVTGLHGGVNVPKLLFGKVALYDVAIDEPMINLVSVNDSVSNYNIVPPSEPDTTAKEPTSMPDISINHFEITRAKPFSYTSIADSISGSIRLNRVDLGHNEEPHYKIEVKGDINSPLIKEFYFENIIMGIDGKIGWSPDEPTTVDINGLRIDIDELSAEISTSVDLGEDMAVNKLDFKLKPIDVAKMMRHVPSEYAPLLKPLKTDMKIDLQCKLTERYLLSDTLSLPSVDAKMRINKCDISYNDIAASKFGATLDLKLKGKDMLNPKGSRNGSVDCKLTIPDFALKIGNGEFKRLGLTAGIKGIGNNINNWLAELHRFVAEGPATTIEVNGKATYLTTDPEVTANLKLNVDMNRFPPMLKRMIPAKISGQITADASVNLRQSYLTGNYFERIKIDGDVNLHKFHAEIPDEHIRAFVNNALLTFGTSSSFITRSGMHVDSLMTASIKVDSAYCYADGIELSMRDVKAGVGASGAIASGDTTQVNPLGGRFEIGRLKFKSPADTLSIRLRDLKCGASLRRYKGNAKVPQLGLVIESKRIGFGMPLLRGGLRDSHFDIRANIRPHSDREKRLKHLRDSIASAHPGLTSDSINGLLKQRARRHGQQSATADNELIDFGVDNSIKSLLRRWDVSGSLKTARGSFITPVIPMRNRISDVDLTFSLDSISLRSLRYEVGQSDFSIKGSISNIRRALMSRRGAPIRINFKVNSDTIHVNEIVQSLYAGSSITTADEMMRAALASDSDDDSMVESQITATDTVQTGPLLVPINVDARLTMRAKNIIYADMPLKRFTGDILIKKGAIKLNRLRATTDMGSIDMTALYEAPDKQNMDFGMGLQVKDFRIDRFLALFPALDSIMPMLNGLSGVVNAEIAATAAIDTMMNIDLPTLKAAVKLTGDSLVLLDSKTFRTLSKWLLFKDKNRNMIDHMSVEMLIEDSQLELFPFMFDLDRYRIGVMGTNDLAMNLNYHISVLKSPIPFKFGVNIKGNADKMKIRLGGAKFKENMAAQRLQIADTTRINLVNRIEDVFRRGTKAARLGRLDTRNAPRQTKPAADDDEDPNFSHADSLYLIENGLIEMPTPPPTPAQTH